MRGTSRGRRSTSTPGTTRWGCRAADDVANKPWTRKHDDPRRALIPQAPRIVYPTSLAELIGLCKHHPPGQRLKAAGSHWSLSAGAISDHTFIETHDPRDRHRAMGKTLKNVIPGCLTHDYVQHMVDLGSDRKWYLVHIESGKRIYQLYAELDGRIDLHDPSTLAGFINTHFHDPGYGGPWGFATLGGAGGQTVVGALSTGTHGGDFDRPPLADSVAALHLVVDGGNHCWIEPVDAGVPPLTDDAKLGAAIKAELGTLENFEIIRDNDVFEAALVSVGRFGVIYSVVLKAVPQYALHEKRRIHLWQDIKGQIKDPNSPLYKDAAPGGTIGPQRFLQIAVSLTTHFNFQRNLVGLTKRWDVRMAPGIPGKAERVGDVAGFDEQIQGLKFKKAGNSHPFSPDEDDPTRGANASLLEIACSDGAFVKGVLATVVTELKRFTDSGGTVVGTAIAAVASVAGGGILAFLLFFAAIIRILKDLIDGIDDHARFGETMEKVKNKLLDPHETDAVKRGAGLFAWQLIYYLAFKDQQSDRDFSAVSYAVMDTHDYLDVGCTVNVDSIEVFFNAADDGLIAFIDALIAFEISQEIQGKAFVGYASMRFTQPTRALIGMQRWPMSCAVEVACLKDVSGGEDLIDFAVRWARNPNSGAILHWGQRNDSTRREVERIYGARLLRWRRALAHLTDEGARDGFSSDFTRSKGLEVV